MSLPPIVHDVAALRRALAPWRGENPKGGIALVPTMGALHDGHLALVHAARGRCAHVVVSIFVNPTQFAPHEDFNAYPRGLEEDCRKLEDTGATLIFAPSADEMYPPGFATSIAVGGPALGLETDSRPHFFAGVATIVAKLLIAAMPDVALFGEKDFQQLLVVRRLVRDLMLPAEIIGIPIIRESDGLAMSSRNVHLSAAERKVAAYLNLVLADIAASLRRGATIADAEAAGAAALKDAGFTATDYFAIRDADTLAPVTTLDRPARILAAAWVGRTRLIDTVPV